MDFLLQNYPSVLNGNKSVLIINNQELFVLFYFLRSNKNVLITFYIIFLKQ